MHPCGMCQRPRHTQLQWIIQIIYYNKPPQRLVGEILVFERGKTKYILISILVALMLLIPIASLGWRIPRASYEIIYSEEFEESESVEIIRFPYSPVSSVILLNDSLLSPSNNWFREQNVRFNTSSIQRLVSIPKLNVSKIIFRLWAYVVSGPMNITLIYYHWPYIFTVTGEEGEYCEIVRNATVGDLPDDDPIWVSATIDGLDWNVVSQLYLSIQVEFTVNVCPVTIDLQRTNGESLFLLQEFYLMRNPPIVKLNGHGFRLSQVNDTIYLPNGNFFLEVDWVSYQHSYTDISLTNESLIIDVRLKTVRLDVEAYQKIPGLTIEITDFYSFSEYNYFYLKDSPSFYLPPETYRIIEVQGEPNDYHNPYHFSIGLDYGENRNITLLVSENWIVIGNWAFTPGILAILFASVLVLLLTLYISRQKIRESTVFLPFILLFLGNLMPSIAITSSKSYPTALPLYSQYTETQLISMGIDISIYRVDDSVTAVSCVNASQFVNQLLFTLLLIVFLGMIFEHLRDEIDSETLNFFVATPTICCFFVQWLYVIGRLVSVSTHFTMTLSLGPFLTSAAIILWYVQFSRSGGKIIQRTQLD